MTTIPHADGVWPAGKKLGPYEIVSFLAAGGMGEVYVARDNRLHRDVAIKVLPLRYGHDPDRLKRFEQEARAASRLNHPNILTVHDVGTDDELPYLVTELLEGKTLRDVLHEQHLSPHQAIDFALQIARGLARAHEKGIAHRDLKPSNIFITADGYVKILDFGLAKLLHPEWERAGSDDDTVSRGTAPGTALGTVGYMSPEQVQGLPADQRADIFSFGALFFELLTGKRAFHRETDVETMHAILKEEPPLREVLLSEDLDLHRLLRRCLQKRPEDRYGSAREVVMALEEIVSVTRALSAISNVKPTFLRRNRAPLVALAVVVAIGLLAGVIVAQRDSSTRTPPEKTFTEMKVQRIPLASRPLQAAISPDGRYVLYVAAVGSRESLIRKDLLTTDEIQLIPPQEVWYGEFAFSPDGGLIHYVLSKGNESHIFEISSNGGLSKQLMDVAGPVSFSPGHDQVAMLQFDQPESGVDTLVVSTLDGSRKRKLLTSPGLLSASWSPDGSRIAIVTAAKDGCDIELVDVASGARSAFAKRNFIEADISEWLPDGSGLILRAAEKGGTRQLWIVDYPAGTFRRITNDLNSYARASVTGDGRSIVAAQFQLQTNIWVAPGGDYRRAQQVTKSSSDVYRRVRWLEDGRIIFPSSVGGSRDLWVMNADGTGTKQLTRNLGGNILPAATRDGRFIVFNSDRTGSGGLWRMNPDGTAPVQLTNATGQNAPEPTGDSRAVVYIGPPPGKPGPPRLRKVSIDGGEVQQLSDESVMFPAVSPDNRWVAAVVIRNGSPNQLGLIPLSGGAAEKLFPLPEGFGGGPLVWTSDSSAVTFIVNRDEVSNLFKQPIAGGAPLPVTEWQSEKIWGFDWSEQGDLVVTRGDYVRDVVMMMNFR